MLNNYSQNIHLNNVMFQDHLKPVRYAILHVYNYHMISDNLRKYVCVYVYERASTHSFAIHITRTVLHV